MTDWLARYLEKVLFVTAAVLIACGVGLGAALDRAQPDRIGLETAKVLITLAAGLLVGGVLKLATESYAQTRKRQEDEANRYDALIRDMHDSHDRMETARLLIAAHRSARTYGAQMRGVIDAHVLLLNIARTPGMGVLEPKMPDAERLECMLGYLAARELEYQEKYKWVSTLQRFDEELHEAGVHALR